MQTHPSFHDATRGLMLAALLLVWSAASAQNGHGTIPIQANQDSTSILTYSIDTLESYPVAPGVVYTRFTITNSSNTRNCYMYDVDLSNPYIRVEETHSETIGKTEAMVTTHKRLDGENHRSVGSVNCNFWETTNNEGLVGVACTGQVSNGKIGASITNWGLGVAASVGLPAEEQLQELGFLMIDTDGKAWVDQYGWNSGIRIGEETYPLRETNRNRTNPQADEIVLFNSDLGTNATRSLDGIYEVVMDLTDDSRWAINKELRGRVISTNTTGGTLIGERQVVLQGRGTGQTFLQKAAVGDTIAFAIGIYRALTQEYPQIAQLSAGNCYVMRDYRLTFRNWAEKYNNQNYPRTGFGVSEDHQRLWMLVMEKPGMYTHEMCSILRHFGACYAMGADGGGSAQFNLFGRIINPTTEGSPRAVSNAIFLFSTSPDDDTPASLLYQDNAPVLQLPSYASYTPRMRAYNKYGVMIAKSFTGYTLSCEPASLGTISADGKTFTASAEGGDGKLIATAGEARVEKAVHIEPGKLDIALDSVIVDVDGYHIEVYSISDAGRMPVDPAMVTWRSSDETIAETSSSGRIHSKKNGAAMIYGTLGDQTDSILARVQMANDEYMTTLMNRDTVLNYSTTRNAAVEMAVNALIFGQPASVTLVINSEAGIKSATVTTHCADVKSHTNSAEVAPVYGAPDETHAIYIKRENFTDNLHAGSYPFYVEKFKCMLQDIEKNKDYRFRLVSVVCEYDAWEEFQALPAIPDDHKPMKLIIGGQLYIMVNNKIYDINGKQIR